MRPPANHRKGHAPEEILEHPLLTLSLAILFIVQWCMTMASMGDPRKKSAAQDATTDPENPEDAEPAKSGHDERVEEPEPAPAPAPAADTSILSPSDSSPKAPLPPGQSHPDTQPGCTAWLTPYLTTGWHKAATLVVYLATLGLQLLEGYWIIRAL